MRGSLGVLCRRMGKDKSKNNFHTCSILAAADVSKRKHCFQFVPSLSLSLFLLQMLEHYISNCKHLTNAFRFVFNTFSLPCTPGTLPPPDCFVLCMMGLGVTKKPSDEIPYLKLRRFYYLVIFILSARECRDWGIFQFFLTLHSSYSNAFLPLTYARLVRPFNGFIVRCECSSGSNLLAILCQRLKNLRQ